MAHSTALPSGSIVETASAFFNDVKPAARSGEGRGHEAAMARRLAQLQSAIGEAPHRPLASPPEAAADTTKPKATPPAPYVGFGLDTVLLSSVLSALFGASLTWVLLDHQAPIMPPALVVQASAPAPVRVEAPMAAAALVAPAPAPVVADETRIAESLQAWRSAWAQRDVATYLAAYGDEFVPADGSDRAAWVQARTRKLSAGAPITLAVNDVTIERVDDNRFTATFLQDYASGAYRETARPKTLIFARHGDDWKIVREIQ